jgi:hypothetical protein
MADPVYNSRPLAIMAVTKEPVKVPEAIIIFRTTLDKLANSGDDIIDDATLTAQNASVDKLVEKQDAMTGGASDKTIIRNDAYGVCFTDYKDNMLSVQIKSNSLDYNAAAALILRNGYEIKKEAVSPANLAISIKKKKGVDNTIIAEVKQPNVTTNYSIDWEYSYDGGQTWTHLNSTPVCSREISDLLTQKRIIVRARFTIGTNGPLDWMVSSPLNL